MAYSTETQVRAWLSTLSTDNPPTTAVIDDRIDLGDKEIKQILGNTVNFTAIDADIAGGGSVPDWLNLLSQYKGGELTLVYYYGATRDVDTPNDIVYLQDKFNDMVMDIKDGKIGVGDYGTGAAKFENNYKNNVRPALGTDKYGEFQTEADLESSRELSDYNGINRD
jgi:hypothetical protein